MFALLDFLYFAKQLSKIEYLHSLLTFTLEIDSLQGSATFPKPGPRGFAFKLNLPTLLRVLD